MCTTWARERPMGHQRSTSRASGCVSRAGRSVIRQRWKHVAGAVERVKKGEMRRDDCSPKFATSDGRDPGLSSWKKTPIPKDK